MKRQVGFTLLELLISISLSGFIMLGMMRLYMGVVRYLEACREMTQTNRKICLLFNQMERDLSTAYIPSLQPEQKPQDEKQDQKAEPEQKTAEQPEAEESSKAEKKALEQRKKFFIATVNDRADAIKIDKKRYEQCKLLSFICSNPLQVYGEKHEQLVRVIYEVLIDKEKSSKDVVSYKLVRKETQDLFNVQGKVDEFERVERSKMVKSYVVADSIKNFVIELVMPKKKKPDDKKNALREIEEIRSCKWGDEKNRTGIVPEKAFIWLDMWDQKKSKATRFCAMFPILSFPTIEPKGTSKKASEVLKTDEREVQPPPTLPEGAQQ